MIIRVPTGSLRHTLLVGAEAGRQFTDNFRNTRYFNNTATTVFAAGGAGDEVLIQPQWTQRTPR